MERTATGTATSETLEAYTVFRAMQDDLWNQMAQLMVKEPRPETRLDSAPP